MSDPIEQLLEVEQQAKQIIAQARDQASETIDRARAEAQKLIAEARDRSRAEAEQIGRRRQAEAEQAYREDLGLTGDLPRACIHPDNIWSLKGLDECLRHRGTGDTAEAKMIRQRLELATARSDLPVGASCHCAQAAMQAIAAE